MEQSIYVTLESLFDIPLATMSILEPVTAKRCLEDGKYHALPNHNYQLLSPAYQPEGMHALQNAMPETILQNVTMTNIPLRIRAMVLRGKTANDKGVVIDSNVTVDIGTWRFTKAVQAELKDALAESFGAPVTLSQESVLAPRTIAGYYQDFNTIIHHDLDGFINQHAEELHVHNLLGGEAIFPLALVKPLPDGWSMASYGTMLKATLSKVLSPELIPLAEYRAAIGIIPTE